TDIRSGRQEQDCLLCLGIPVRLEMAITLRRPEFDKASTKSIVVPAKAGTHNHRSWSLQKWLPYRPIDRPRRVGPGARFAWPGRREKNFKTAAGSAPPSGVPETPRHRQSATETLAPFCLPARLPYRAR